MSSYERGMDLFPENRCNQKEPNITSMAWCWTPFLLRFGAVFEDKSVYVPLVFLYRIDILRSAHHGNYTLSEQKMNTFSV